MKRKIVRVFEVTAPEKKASQLIKEVSLVDKVKQAFGQKKPAEPPETPGDNHGLKADGETSIQQVLGRIFSVPGDSVRCVLYLNDADLKGRYLTQGGEQQIADAMDDQLFVVSHANSDEIDGRFHKASGVFALDDVTGAWSSFNPYAVLFNVKKEVFKRFEAAATIQEKRAAFVECIKHKFYVAVLNTNAIKKAKVGPLSDEEEREKKFDVKKFITAYPVRAVIDAAREEQDNREATADVDLAVGDEKTVKTIVDRAIAFIFKTLKNGPPKTAVAKANFDKSLKDIFFAAPELNGREELIPMVIDAFINSPAMIKADVYDLLSVLGKKPIGLAVQNDDDGGAKPAKNSKAANIDVVGKSPKELAHELAGAHDPAFAKELIANLRQFSGYKDL